VINNPPKAKSESPIICLQPLEAKCSGVDDLSDGVQSMDVRLAFNKVLLQRK